MARTVQKLQLTRTVDFDFRRIASWHNAGCERTVWNAQSLVCDVDLVRTFAAQNASTIHAPHSHATVLVSCRRWS